MCRHTRGERLTHKHIRAAGVLDFVFLLSTDVIVFLMVLEVITPCNVTQRLLLSSKPQHGGSDVPYIHNHSLPTNDSISQNASAVASYCAGI